MTVHQLTWCTLCPCMFIQIVCKVSSTMTVIRNLGLLLSFQKFFTIPNFNANRLVTAFRSIPLITLLLLATSDLIQMITIMKVTPSSEIRNFADFVARLEPLINRSTFILIYIFAILQNSKHLKLICHLVQFERKLKDLCLIPKTSSALWQSNFATIISIVTNLTFYISVLKYSVKFELNLWTILTIIAHMSIIVSNDILVLYMTHLIKNVKNYANCIMACGGTRNELSLQLIIIDYLKLPPIINSANGKVLFVVYLHYMGNSALVSYYVFWVIYEWLTNIFFIIGLCFTLILHNIIYILYLSIMGSKLSEMVNSDFTHTRS